IASTDKIHLTDINGRSYIIGDLTGEAMIGGEVNLKNGGIFGTAGAAVTLADGFNLGGGSGGGSGGVGGGSGAGGGGSGSDVGGSIGGGNGGANVYGKY
ncbi:MAG: hypothetical protein FWH01_16915, partial [Oscillospiraceae bacterium]|nr:hypothetical protein [Oscillospiraceae bacterium]